MAGNILGVCLFAGCNNVRITQDLNYLTMAKELARENVLLLATGCGAGVYTGIIRRKVKIRMDLDEIDRRRVGIASWLI